MKESCPVSRHRARNKRIRGKGGNFYLVVVVVVVEVLVVAMMLLVVTILPKPFESWIVWPELEWKISLQTAVMTSANFLLGYVVATTLVQNTHEVSKLLLWAYTFLALGIKIVLRHIHCPCLRGLHNLAWKTYPYT